MKLKLISCILLLAACSKNTAKVETQSTHFSTEGKKVKVYTTADSTSHRPCINRHSFLQRAGTTERN